VVSNYGRGWLPTSEFAASSLELWPQKTQTPHFAARKPVGGTGASPDRLTRVSLVPFSGGVARAWAIAPQRRVHMMMICSFLEEHLGFFYYSTASIWFAILFRQLMKSSGCNLSGCCGINCVRRFLPHCPENRSSTHYIEVPQRGFPHSLRDSRWTGISITQNSSSDLIWSNLLSIICTCVLSFRVPTNVSLNTGHVVAAVFWPRNSS